MSFEYDLICAMRESDLHINSINTETGKYHRFRSLGTCKTKCCEYRVFENQLGAHFKCFRRGIDRFWFANREQVLSMSDRRLIQEERDRVNRERLAGYARMSSKCVRFLALAERLGVTPTHHPYVLRKRIYPHAARLVRGLIVLPVLDIEGRLMSLQFIKPNGFKQFKAGAPASEGAIWLGGHLPEGYNGVVRLCEGWSTGCTIYSITKSPVICALNAYNLVKVAIQVKQYYPDAHVKICADNDAWGKDNVGLECALKAAQQTGYIIHYPMFEGLDTFMQPTDFNDLYLLAGRDIVRKQLISIRGKR